MSNQRAPDEYNARQRLAVLPKAETTAEHNARLKKLGAIIPNGASEMTIRAKAATVADIDTVKKVAECAGMDVSITSFKLNHVSPPIEKVGVKLGKLPTAAKIEKVLGSVAEGVGETVKDAVTFKEYREAWNDETGSKAAALSAKTAASTSASVLYGSAAGAATVAVVTLFTGGLATIPALLVYTAGSSVVSYGAGEAAGMAAGKSIEEMCEKLGKLRTGREPGSVRWVADKLRKKAKGPMLKAYNREKQA